MLADQIPTWLLYLPAVLLAIAFILFILNFVFCVLFGCEEDE